MPTFCNVCNVGGQLFTLFNLMLLLMNLLLVLKEQQRKHPNNTPNSQPNRTPQLITKPNTPQIPLFVAQFRYRG